MRHSKLSKRASVRKASSRGSSFNQQNQSRFCLAQNRSSAVM